MKTETVQGKYVNLRIANEQDAEFTLSARQNKEKNVYIPSIHISLEQQRSWINKQIASDDCYFFVVERKNGECIGTFSLYDIHGDIGESGRLVMLGTPLESLETGMLFNDFTFRIANMRIVESEIDAENNAAIGFSKRLGGKPVGEKIDSKTGRRMIIYHATPENFYKEMPKLQMIIDRFGERKN